ncbi:MAG: NUDIX hydrolase [Elusimicrobiaceae bacterium]|nr:NUDIX hydrolase [Elusimicrobiaceae bacterium]
MPAKKQHRLLEKTIKKNPVYKGGAVDFYVDTVEMINGKTAAREYLNHPGAVAVLPVLDTGEVILVEQYRYPVGEATLEIPAGKMHRGTDSPLKRAREELREETGYTARKIEKLTTFWPCCAFSNEALHIYIATGLVPGKAQPDDDEFLNVRKMPFEKACRLVETGRLKDSKTIIALQACAIKQLRRAGRTP